MEAGNMLPPALPRDCHPASPLTSSRGRSSSRSSSPRNLPMTWPVADTEGGKKRGPRLRTAPPSRNRRPLPLPAMLLLRAHCVPQKLAVASRVAAPGAGALVWPAWLVTGHHGAQLRRNSRQIVVWFRPRRARPGSAPACAGPPANCALPHCVVVVHRHPPDRVRTSSRFSSFTPHADPVALGS